MNSRVGERLAARRYKVDNEMPCCLYKVDNDGQ